MCKTEAAFRLRPRRRHLALSLYFSTTLFQYDDVQLCHVQRSVIEGN